MTVELCTSAPYWSGSYLNIKRTPHCTATISTIKYQVLEQEFQYVSYKYIYIYLSLGSVSVQSHRVASPTELGEDEPFLCTDQGSPFTPVFRHIRLQYIINDLASARILERDNIIPPGKILPYTFTVIT